MDPVGSIGQFKFSHYLRDAKMPISVRVMRYSPLNATGRQHTHDFSEIVLIMEGSVTHCCGAERTRLTRGNFFVIHPGPSHAYVDLSEDLEVYNLIYDASVPIPALLASSLPMVPVVYPSGSSPLSEAGWSGVLGRVPAKELAPLRGMLDAIRAVAVRRKAGRPILVGSLFAASVVELNSFLRRGATTAVLPWNLQRAVGYLQEHSAERIPVRELAQVCGMSVRSLMRGFQRSFGMGPGAYLRNLRVQGAVRLLRETDLTIDDIAQRTGFCDAGHLCRVLSRKLETTPGRLRRMGE